MLKRLIVPQHTAEAHISADGVVKSSMICSVLSSLQYLTSIPVRSSSSILVVGVKQSTVATLKRRAECEEEKGAGLVVSFDLLCTYKTIHYLSLAQINTTKNTESNIHEPASSQPFGKKVGIPLT